MGLIRYSCGHISGHREPIHVKFVWGVFITFYWNMVVKILECKKENLMMPHFSTLYLVQAQVGCDINSKFTGHCVKTQMSMWWPTPCEIHTPDTSTWNFYSPCGRFNQNIKHRVCFFSIDFLNMLVHIWKLHGTHAVLKISEEGGRVIRPQFSQNISSE